MGRDAVHRHSGIAANRIGAADGGESEVRKVKGMKSVCGIGAIAAFLAVAILSATGSPDQAAVKTAVPTFTKDVAPILYKNCTGCHRPGEIGPMSLLTYDDVRP